MLSLFTCFLMFFLSFSLLWPFRVLLLLCAKFIQFLHYIKLYPPYATAVLINFRARRGSFCSFPALPAPAPLPSDTHPSRQHAQCTSAPAPPSVCPSCNNTNIPRVMMLNYIRLNRCPHPSFPCPTAPVPERTCVLSCRQLAHSLWFMLASSRQIHLQISDSLRQAVALETNINMLARRVHIMSSFLFLLFPRLLLLLGIFNVFNWKLACGMDLVSFWPGCYGMEAECLVCLLAKALRALKLFIDTQSQSQQIDAACVTFTCDLY